MIIDISDFMQVFKNTEFHLPIRWNNKDFVTTLQALFDKYQKALKGIKPNNPSEDTSIFVDSKKINSYCKRIINAVNAYLNGQPSNAFVNFSRLMEEIDKDSVLSHKRVIFNNYVTKKKLYLYRVTSVNDNMPYNRDRVFHTPYDFRSKIATTRYSIAGFPSLYLGTSLRLCCEEIHMNPHTQFALASRFEMTSNAEEIRIIDLAIKPQDFLITENTYSQNDKKTRHEQIQGTINTPEICQEYLLWYPLIAACSFIRVAKNDPFAVEYIIPQLLMQWVRKEANDGQGKGELVGIRYFSCASVRASEMGFNYVFPTVTKIENSQYCPVLAQSFKLTEPHYIHEYDNIERCEEALRDDMNLDFI